MCLRAYASERVKKCIEFERTFVSYIPKIEFISSKVTSYFFYLSLSKN